MISGRQALGSIDQALNKAHEQITSLQAEISAASDQLLAQQKAQADDYRSLARVRLDRLADDEVFDTLDHTEQQLLILRGRRDTALEKLQQRIAEAEGLRQRHEAERQQQADRLDSAVSIVDEAEAKTQARLDADPPYREQRDRAEQAERKAMHADEKALRSEEEREHKGEAYRADPLFIYLWERHYGLPEYEAGGLIRWLDGKVARLIGYADVRVNYARLNEIPKRLREHAKHLKDLADAEFLKLRKLDEIALAADGIPELEERVAEEQRLLDKIDARIAQDEQHHQSLLSEQARFAAGDDDHMRAAVEFLVNEFRRDDLVQLRHEAISTPYPDDDVVVSRMFQREQDGQQFEASIQGLKSALDQQQQRLVELESLRVEFKRNHFDRAGSVFANDSMIPVLLGQFLAGMLDRGMLWKVLQEQQGYRPKHSDPDFGSGGFGRGTVWKGGLGDIIEGLGRGGFGGLGRRGGFGGRGGGGGGFRTGGGF